MKTPESVVGEMPAMQGRLTAVMIDQVSKVYEPSPLWLRFLLRSAVRTPVQALDHVTLSLAAGEICAIVGPNGAGKSTLFRVLTGLTTPTSGCVHVHGIDVSRDPGGARALIGFVPAGDQTLYLRLTCLENLVFHGRLQGLSTGELRKRIDQTLAIVGLADLGDRVGFALSAGMRARLQLARALLHRPRVLVLDEPTAAVDPVGSYELLEVIQKVAADQGVSVLLSSHRLEEIEALHDRVALLDGGRIVYLGDLDTLRRRFQRPVVELVFKTAIHSRRAAMLLDDVAGIEILEQESTRLSVATRTGVGFVLQHLVSELPGLESVEENSLPLRKLLHDVLGSVVPPTVDS